MIRSRSDYRYYLRADLQAHGVSRWYWWMRFKHDVVHWQRLLRRTEYLVNCRTHLLWKPLVYLCKYNFRQRSIRLGFEIPINVFGHGLCVTHWGSLVVNPAARVGSGCRIHPGVTIGEEKDQVPVIGKRAYIGPGAKIFGGIRLGDDVAVGANAVVNKSWGNRVTLVGIPASPTEHKIKPFSTPPLQ